MDNFDTKSYYALLWNTSLDLGREMKVKGNVLCKDSELPDDPRILYGANMNDVAKIRKPKLWKKIEYDVRTTQQKVLFWSDTDEYTFLRDVRIVVWVGHKELWLPYDDYKIVTPEHFKMLADVSKYYKNEVDEEFIDNVNSMLTYIDPKEKLERDILDKIISNSDKVKDPFSCNSNNTNVIKSEKVVSDERILDSFGLATS